MKRAVALLQGVLPFLRTRIVRAPLSTLVCGLMLWGALPVEGQWLRWPIQKGGNGHWYQVFRTPNLVSWATAFTNAQAEGGYLATITSSQENTFVFQLASHPSYWNGEFGPLIGGYQPPESAEPAGGWTWVTGEPWEYSNWAGGQPDDGNQPHGEASVHFWGGAAWNDFPTNWTYFVSYVVERETTPPPLAAQIRFSQVEISWETVSNALYQIEYRSDLTTNMWTPLTTNTIVGTGDRYSVYDALPTETPKRFYRIVEK